MVHLLLGLAAVLFILWIVGLAGSWAAGTAWTLFVIAMVLFAIWLFVSVLSRPRSLV